VSGLTVEGLVKRFGSTVAVDGVSLAVADGEVVALLGPSGCGKSTLLRLIAGLEAPDAGRVLVDGHDVTALAPAERDVAMVFQSYALYPHMTVEGNVAVPLRLRKVGGDEVRRRVAETAELLGIGHLLQRRPRQLSGGQRQRVALARAIVRQPRLFLLDEPLSNLDALLRERTRRELKLLFARLGTTVVYVTHDQAEAMTLAQRVAVLRDGRIEQVGPPQEIYRRPASRFVAGFVGSPGMNLLEARAAEGRLWLSAGGQPVAGLPAPRGLEDGGVTVGLRPEDLRLARAGGGAHDGRGVEGREGEAAPPVHVAARVVVAESYGSHSVVTVALDGDGTPGPRLQVVTEPGDWRRGEAVSLAVPVERLHLFDAGDGRRLEIADLGG